MNLEDRVAATVDRMTSAEAQRWHRHTIPAAATIERGTFYAGGPVCLVALDAAGNRLQTITERDALASPWAAEITRA